MTRALDDWIARVAKDLSRLPRKSFALFFAYVAERLIPLYFAFVRKHGWGDAAELRRLLDFVWSALDGPPAVVHSNLPHRLEDITPSGDQFDSPDSTYAQDAVICIDVALRALMPDEALDGNWVEYAVEPIYTQVSIEKTGYVQVGSAEAPEWERRLMEAPAVAAFLADCESLLLRLKGAAPRADELCVEARSKGLRPEEFIEPR